MRKTYTLIMLIAILICAAAPASAQNETYPVTLEEARRHVNEEMENVFVEREYCPTGIIINNSLLFLNEAAWRSHTALAYGTYFGSTAANGERRYLGYNPLGNEFPSPNYPPDSSASTSLNKWKWQEYPWLFGWGGDDLYADLPNETELRASLNQKIKDGIKHSYGGFFNEDEDREWWKYVLVLQPPTKYTYGYGRMWHLWDSNKDGTPEHWYITVRLLPDMLPPNIEVVRLSSPAIAAVGSHQTATALYRNSGTTEQTFSGVFSVDDTAILTESISLAPGQYLNRDYSWTAPAKAGKATLKAEAVPVPNEINTADNTKTTIVTIKKLSPPKAPVCPSCLEKPEIKISDNWEELYEWQIYHPDTCPGYDKDGKPCEIDCSWWEQQSALSTYSESLTSQLSVDTKQGLATDRDKPRESDRESRGSWEIIPYARDNKLDPNEVTRAGYGFEVKVITTYRTDWESKVPEGASAHGGTYSGPQKVTAQFYDTSFRAVEEIELEATSGSPGGEKITWELPQSRFKFSDGTETWQRKHYTDVTNKDGYYTVRILVEACGRGALAICQDKYVLIYGDMYDDIYTRSARRDEW